jgi:hypothetical protein
MVNIQIQQWDKDRFFQSRKEWNELLKSSNSDQLFLSWEWQSTWWKIFSEPEDVNSARMELKLYVATTDDGSLVGIAPLYLTTVYTKKIIKTKRLQFIGNCWRGKPTMLTELLDFIVISTQSKNVVRALYSHIKKIKDWDEFVIPFLNVQSETYQLLSNENLLPRCYLRHAEEYKSYYLNIKGQFQDYAKNLGKNTRLKFINRRKMFQELGETSFTRMLTDNIKENFNLLNKLHIKRWGKPIFYGKRLEFNQLAAELLAERYCLNFSVLSLNHEPVSIQYNFVINKHNYNIQAGFDETFHKKISLGYLHFGYEIEASFTEQISTYDFLAGEGKNTQYKERLTNDYLQMIDLQIVRKPALKMLYKFYASIR